MRSSASRESRTNRVFAIDGKALVMRKQGRRFDQCLRHQSTIERIAMM